MLISALKAHFFNVHFVVSYFSQFDMPSVPWGEDPTPLVATIQSMVRADIQSGGKEEHLGTLANLKLDERIANLKRPLKWTTKYNRVSI